MLGWGLFEREGLLLICSSRLGLIRGVAYSKIYVNDLGTKGKTEVEPTYESRMRQNI